MSKISVKTSEKRSSSHLNDRIHRAMSADGTEIAGCVYGNGPPIVFIHGGFGDGESSWQFLLPLLTDRFTCYTMSTRGRGLSADNPDHSIGKLLNDVTVFVESIGEPVGIMGISSGAVLALATAARIDDISALVAYEPPVWTLLNEENTPDPSDFLSAASEGRFVDALRIFFEDSGIFNDEEIAAMAKPGIYEILAPNVPAGILELSEYPLAMDTSMLDQITIPVLLVHGERTSAWHKESVHYLSERFKDAQVTEIPGAGHTGPLLAPEVIAKELVRFFSENLT